jgi:hypothetical protein
MNESASAPVLRACGLRKEYGRGDGLVRAVDEVNLKWPAARRWR